MPTRPAISFVIPVRNDAVRLQRCLASVAVAAQTTPIEVIVADNGSADDTPAAARAMGATVVSVPNRVVAAVRNIGVKATAGDLLAFVDADHELHRDWVAAVLTVMADPSVSGAGCDYHPPPGSTWVQRMYDRLRRHPHTQEDVAWLPSGNLVVRRHAFEAAGGFDESLESCEDVDLCRRLRQTGARLVAAPTLYSTHHGDPKTLRAVFWSELWRGRDNLRVTLREGLDARNLLGLGVSILYLVGICSIVAGLMAWLFGNVVVLAGAVVLLLLLTAARVLRLVRAGGSPIEAVPFAVTFDSARALALVVRVGHGTRRKA